MTERSDTGYVGTHKNDGDYFGRAVCNDGQYIKRLEGRAGRNIDQFGAVCSDGVKLGPYGYSGGGAPYSIDGPFRSLDLVAEGWVDGLFNFGEPRTNKTTISCPNGKYVVGFEGRAGEYLAGNFRAICGVKADEYCVNNLETDLCRNIDRDTLNKACSKNMSTTCKNRKDELDESVIYNYCRNNKNDPFCSCYADPPSYIPEEIKGMVKCWNKTCATQGYIPKNLRNLQCPPITICKQDTGVEGSNVLSSNVFVQDCGTRLIQGSSSNQPTTTVKDPANNTNTNTVFNDPSKSPYVPSSPDVVTNTSSGDKAKEFIKKNLKVILVVLFVVFAILLASFRNSSKPVNIQNMQQMPMNNMQSMQQMPMQSTISTAS
jgi:hypothetical protein